MSAHSCAVLPEEHIMFIKFEDKYVTGKGTPKTETEFSKNEAPVRTLPAHVTAR